MDKQWYVIHAYSGYETKVREALIERIERLGMNDLFGEIMVSRISRICTGGSVWFFLDLIWKISSM